MHVAEWTLQYLQPTTKQNNYFSVTPLSCTDLIAKDFLICVCYHPMSSATDIYYGTTLVACVKDSFVPLTQLSPGHIRHWVHLSSQSRLS